MWHGIASREGAAGAPLLVGALGWLECRLDAEHETGDHTLFVGEVLSVELGEPAPPLVHVESGYRIAVIEAVVFDLDGVLIQTEEIWDEVRERLHRASAAAGTTRRRSGR